MRLLKDVQGIQVNLLEGEDTTLSFPIYEIKDPINFVRLPADVAPRVALEILKDVFLGNGKPCLPAEALQCLEALLPRVEAAPGKWWNMPDVHESPAK